jgi:hypothetical protein
MLEVILATGTVCALVIFVLAIKIALLKSRLAGFREAQHYTGGTWVGGGTDRTVRFLALVGFVAICGVCFYAGSVVAVLGG